MTLARFNRCASDNDQECVAVEGTPPPLTAEFTDTTTCPDPTSDDSLGTPILLTIDTGVTDADGGFRFELFTEGVVLRPSSAGDSFFGTGPAFTAAGCVRQDFDAQAQPPFTSFVGFVCPEGDLSSSTIQLCVFDQDLPFDTPIALTVDLEVLTEDAQNGFAPACERSSSTIEVQRPG
mmetsp:Transcript_35215/g.69481  ORF Transcript_35215/g.69481 Transcript_35215/m.69481 type:complete len:178 (+) Transcript_35215:1318-1851(+)